MSHSIHTTTRSLKDARRQHDDSEEIDRLEAILLRKRRIKKLVSDERLVASLPVRSGFSSEVPIRQVVVSDYAHFPASASDLQDLFAYLPAGSLDGVSEIILDLRADNPSARIEDEAYVDPWLATPSYEMLPDVYVGEVLGTYFEESSKIKLYAFTYDPSNPGLKDWGILLRLWAFETFLHELAHHFDYRRRTERGRRLADDTDKKEAFADQMAYEWTVEYAVPYLERKYSKEQEALREWTAYYGGVDVGLAAFVSQATFVHLAFPPRDAVSSLVEEIKCYSTLNSCRLVFATYLHFSELYEEALQSVQTVLTAEPENVEALTLRADIFVHQERYVEAIKIATGLLHEKSATNRTFRVLMDAYEGVQNWTRVIGVADLVLQLPDREEFDYIQALRHRARAYLRISRLAEAKWDIRELEKSQQRRYRRQLGNWIIRLRRELTSLKGELAEEERAG